MNQNLVGRFCIKFLQSRMKGEGAVVAVILWYIFDLQLVPITTDVVSSNLDLGEVYNIM
jgi:hypothetical protein